MPRFYAYSVNVVPKLQVLNDAGGTGDCVVPTGTDTVYTSTIPITATTTTTTTTTPTIVEGIPPTTVSIITGPQIPPDIS
jgi:hypothetical protein